jgi:predicted RNA polymerase sigma factor
LTGLERAFREEWSAIVAALARRIGLQAAEDAAAEAFAAAVSRRSWPTSSGVNPDSGECDTAFRGS